MLLSWRMLFVIYCCFRTGVRSSRPALFPAASRVRREAEANLAFHRSIHDVNLLFEILMTGTHFEANGKFSVQDAELASLRKARNLEVICEEIIPRKFTDISELIANLSNHTGRLHLDDFERTLMTLVFTAQKIVDSNQQQRDMWAESFVSLYRAIKQDLMEEN